MDDRELSLFVVGLQYPNPDKAKSNRRFEVALCAPGEPVELRLEPTNPADENAVAVFSARGIQLGYLKAERAPWIGGKIKAGEIFEAVFQEPGVAFAVIRVRFGGGTPTLPAPREPRGLVQDDFYPDPEPPEGIDPEGSDWGA